ncbi:hypothetical protein DPMN_120437 [Dreissena polymorpha]|uniref:Uncharacterized protein n=1 Tax=Dreissena polymorpha TaxID=45954 RepID=A0A9D4GNJ3_DREPO|nr:hypothetical protein DPMN_120437 [Dreissena polymorpha]
MSHVHGNSVPDQDQQPSNHFILQPTVRGANSEVLEDDENHTKTQTKEKEKTDTSMPTKNEKGEHAEKHVKFSEDVKSDDSLNDVKDFIKQYVKQEFKSKKSDIKRLCDAVIVYDKNDYEYVVDMRDKIKDIVLKELNEDLHIELFDDEKFVQSHVQVVQDVLKNASVVLVYLSMNTQNSRGVQFFIDEAVVMKKIDHATFTSEDEFIVRPVHSQPPNQLNYRTPPGLASVSGIDWFDKSKYTNDRIVAIMRNAIRKRKLIENPRRVQGEFRQTSLQTGLFPHQPHHGGDAPQHQWIAGASSFTTSGERYTPQATAAPKYMETSEPTQRSFNISSTENMMRRINRAPNQGPFGYSYTQGGEHFLRMGEGYIQSEYCHVYENDNTSFTPYGELHVVLPFGIQQTTS